MSFVFLYACESTAEGKDTVSSDTEAVTAESRTEADASLTDMPTDTDADAPTGASTDATEDTQPAGSSDTDGDAETQETESQTDEETEVPTQGDGATLSFPLDCQTGDFLKLSSIKASVTAVDENNPESGTMLNFNVSNSRASRLVFNYQNCANSLNLIPITTEQAKYMIMTVHSDNMKSGMFTLRYVTDSEENRIDYSKACMFDEDGWTDLVFDFTDTAWKGIPCNFSFEFDSAVSKGTTFSVRSIRFYEDVNSMLTALGQTEYLLGGKTDIQVTNDDNDPLRYVDMVAPDQDDSVAFWFDQISEKVLQKKYEKTDRRGFTIYMAKNEAECCQFFLSPDSDRQFRIELDPLTDEDGHELAVQVFYEYYHSVQEVMTPDGLPPLTGPITVKSGDSQGFVIQVTTKPEDAAGYYSGILHVYDGKTGKEIKRAPVGVNVWNFALSEETYLRTAFGLYSKQLKNGWPSDYDKSTLYKNSYDFLLTYRVNCLDLPSGVNTKKGKAYLANPRVNTVRIKKFDDFTAPDVPQEQLDKIMFYIVDEPDSNDKIAALRNTGKIGAEVYPQFRMVSPFYCNKNLDENFLITDRTESTIDQIEYMKQDIKIWCVKFEAFTPRSLEHFSNAFFLQSKWQDLTYGIFADRMKAEVEEGDELWAYVCCSPRKPYCNWQLTSDGIETIISIWQCKMLNCTGMLGWCINYWNVDDYYHDTMANVLTAPGVYWGDGMMIYSGAPFGLDRPISTLRLENLRDGIEDYQMLCMLEEALGREKTDEIVSLVTTSVVTFTTDDDYLHAVRILLGRTLEEALNAAE